MEKEISSGTMLGIVLIALAAVIGLGFGVFSIAKGVANEGTVGVQDNLNTVTDSAFEDYNDKVVTGTQVKSAIQNFEGKSVAILVNTTAMNKGVKCYANRTVANDTYKTGGVTVWTVGSDGKPYVNYNALLASSAEGTPLICLTGTDSSAVAVGESDADGNVTSKGTALMNDKGEESAPTLKDGIITTAAPFAIDDDGKVIYDYSIGGLSRSGNCEYVSPSSKFEANIIKDTSGTNVGIMFTQMAQ